MVNRSQPRAEMQKHSTRFGRDVYFLINDPCIVLFRDPWGGDRHTFIEDSLTR